MIRATLRELMTKKCVAMSRESARCYKSGRCDGQCPEFIEAVIELEDREEYLTNKEE